MDEENAYIYNTALAEVTICRLLVHCMEKWQLWERNGLDVELTLAKDAAQAEAMLESGQVDFVFGNHITPYY